MRLEDIYNIIKKSSLEDFYVSTNESSFIYKEDVNLTIEENEEKEDNDAFGYEYFFDADNKPFKHVLSNPSDKLVYDAAQLKNFPETYGRGTSIVTWEVKYGEKVVHELSYVLVSNLSSLHILLPLSVKTKDYSYNFADIWNKKNSPNELFDLEAKLSIKDTTFDDFLDS